MAQGYTNTIECPRGCKASGGKPIAATIRGWKKHMTHNHGGWEDNELAMIVGSVAPSENGRSLFLAEADTIPGQDPAIEGAPPTDGASAASSTQPPGPEPIKRVPLKSKKLKKILSTLPETFLKSKGVVTDDDDKEIIEAASEMMEELFGIAFEIPDSMWVIRSRWIAILFPIGAVVIVWLKHSIGLPAKKDEAPNA